MFLCLGSTLAALFGLLVLGWGARQRRWPLLWVLIAALFLIGAGLGAAETVYQIAAEREDAPQQTPISAIPATPLPEREQLPTVTTRGTLPPGNRGTLPPGNRGTLPPGNRGTLP
jgi:hypothetical protein